jgi:trigger factor
MDAYLSTIGKTADELHEDARIPAIEKIKRTLILRQMAEEEGVEVSDEEVDAEIDTVMQLQATMMGDSFSEYINSEDGRRSVQNVLKNRKTVNILIATAKLASGEKDAGKKKPAAKSRKATKKNT